MIRAATFVAALFVITGCAQDQDTRRFRVPSSSMEPTLHCARPAIGCEAAQPDKLAVRSYGDARPKRGDLVVFKTPPTARVRCGVGGTFVKRLIGLPGERWSERVGVIYRLAHLGDCPRQEPGRQGHRDRARIEADPHSLASAFGLRASSL